MKYQDKLTTSVCAGAVIGLMGNLVNCPLITSAGLGLISSGYVGTFLETDEYEEMRAELNKRDKLVKRALECFQMH